MARRITSKRIHLDRLSVKAAVAVVEATKPGRSGTSAEHERRGRADEEEGSTTIETQHVFTSPCTESSRRFARCRLNYNYT